MNSSRAATVAPLWIKLSLPYGCRRSVEYARATTDTSRRLDVRRWMRPFDRGLPPCESAGTYRVHTSRRPR